MPAQKPGAKMEIPAKTWSQPRWLGLYYASQASKTEILDETA